ncbi:hypothetical protein FOL47_008648 [Perkinsus chesapeaki]|uniref:Amine oxidase n=1 Tax=Perkinsus chesapeaki TaxID=330153 RepID=A0A7J6LCZ8_PERCH|nr:hypothetical protein FOL47_008648 [Perkinsus chesapeaki]
MKQVEAFFLVFSFLHRTGQGQNGSTAEFNNRLYVEECAEVCPYAADRQLELKVFDVSQVSIINHHDQSRCLAHKVCWECIGDDECEFAQCLQEHPTLCGLDRFLFTCNCAAGLSMVDVLKAYFPNKTKQEMQAREACVPADMFEKSDTCYGNAMEGSEAAAAPWPRISVSGGLVVLTVYMLCGLHDSHQMRAFCPILFSLFMSKSHCEDVVDLAVVIPTAPTETDRRCVVRDSWARQLTGIEKETGRRVKLYFTIGDSSELPSDVRARLDMEKAQFSDIHELVGFADSYNRLGLKALVEFLFRLLSILDDKKAFDLPRVYAGEFWSYLEILQPALKTSTGLDYYPTNARGAGYVLSYELVNLVAKSPVPFKQVDAEDAMIGLFLAPYEYERISYEVQPMTPQCGCAITCLKDKWESKGKNYYIDHYNKRETLRWKQRRYELFGDSCWKLEQEREEGLESCRRATLQIGDDERFYFDTVTRASIPDGVIVADHTSTRSGVCKVTFQWAPEEWGSCSKDCGGGVRRRCVKCSGPDGHAFDDVECDSQTRPSDEESFLPMESDCLTAPSLLDVIIVGGGAAGLAAARALQSYNVAVLEARPRLGGRISPTKWHRGVAIDMGAQYIHGVCAENPMVSIANRGGLHVHQYPGSDEDYITMLRAYGSDGRLYSQEELRSAYTRVEELLEKVQKVCSELDDSVNLEEGVRMSGVDLDVEDELVRYLWWYLVRTWMGVSSDSQLRATEFDGSEGTGRFEGPDGKIEEGMYALVEVLEEECSTTHFYLGTEVVTVDQSGLECGPVQVTTRDGRLYHAKACICTVPLGVIQSERIRFIPEMPSEQFDSIQRLGTGTSEKIFLGWDKGEPIPADKDGIAVISSDGQQNWLFEVLSSSAVTAQVVDISGKEAIDGAIEALRGVLPNLPPPDRTGVTFFCSGLYSMGSYSHYRPSSTEVDVNNAARRHGLVWFAGEHCDPEYQGAVHAALITGGKAAAEVSDYLANY